MFSFLLMLPWATLLRVESKKGIAKWTVLPLSRDLGGLLGTMHLPSHCVVFARPQGV